MNLSDAIVLVVEDELDLLEVTAESLAPVVRNVLKAKHGAEALKLIENTKVDAILSDIRMPVMDGVALLENLNARVPARPPVIFVSGFSDTSVRSALDLGAAATLAKPVRRKDLIQTFERILTDKNERWTQPCPEASTSLSTTFASVARAKSDADIAFGIGGFCIRTVDEVHEGPLNLRLNFAEDRQTISGTGVVRWADEKNHKVGIEIMYLIDDCRSWARGLTLHNENRPFIPKDTE